MVSAAVGDAAQAQPGCDLALVHDPVGSKRRILEVMHDERAEILGVGEDVAHHLGVGEARLAIAEGDRARLMQEPDLGHLLALEAFGHGGHRVDIDEGGVARAPEDEVDQRHVVDDRLGIGHADDGGDATCRGGAACRGKRLAMLVARLSGEHHRVDQTGSKHAAGAVDDLGIARSACRDAGPEIGDGAVHDQRAALAVETRGGIDQARIDEGNSRGAVPVLVERMCRGHRLGSWRAKAWSTAMRTATPISTCSRMTLRASSATFESISTPRFIGPGCITSASGLARASLS